MPVVKDTEIGKLREARRRYGLIGNKSRLAGAQREGRKKVEKKKERGRRSLRIHQRD